MFQIMSIDRYIAVCHTFSNKAQKLRTQTSAIIITICVWIISLLLCIPVMMHSFKIGNYPHCFCRLVCDSGILNSVRWELLTLFYAGYFYTLFYAEREGNLPPIPPLCNFSRRTCRTKIFGWHFGLILIFSL